MSAKALVDRQAEDAGLWFEAVTAPESYLQSALRALHAEVEREAAMLAESPDVEGLVKELRAYLPDDGDFGVPELCQAAADALLSLSAKVKALEEALVKKESVERGSRLVIATQSRALHEIGEKMVELKGHAEAMAKSHDLSAYDYSGAFAAYRRDYPEET